MLEKNKANKKTKSLKNWPKKSSFRSRVDFLIALSKTLSFKGDWVMDCCSGSWTTLISALVNEGYCVSAEVDKRQHDTLLGHVLRIEEDPLGESGLLEPTAAHFCSEPVAPIRHGIPGEYVQVFFANKSVVFGEEMERMRDIAEGISTENIDANVSAHDPTDVHYPDLAP